jgi:hypothetical protein
MSIVSAFRDIRAAGVNVDQQIRRRLSLASEVVNGSSVVYAADVRATIAKAKKAKPVKDEDEDEETDDDEDEESDDDEDEESDDDEEQAQLEGQPPDPPHEPTPKKKKKKTKAPAKDETSALTPKQLARAVARALALPAQRAEVARAEREHHAAMAHVEVRMPGAAATVRRVHVRECAEELARLDAVDEATSLGLSAMEIAICTSQGVSPESFARTKTAQASEAPLANAAWDAATGRRIY